MFLSICHFPFSIFPQTSTVSPYSRYGLGDLSGGSSAQSLSMGGLNIGLTNDSIVPFYINSANPASFISNRITSYEAGVVSNMLKLQTESSKATVNSASIAYLSFAVPVKKWWGLSMGLLPYSSVGYKVTEHKVLDSIGDVDHYYEGSGGINKLYLGNAIQPFSNAVINLRGSSSYRKLVRERDSLLRTGSREDSLRSRKIAQDIYYLEKRRANLASFSAGLNVSLLFGNLDNTRRVVYPNTSLSQFYYNTLNSRTTRVRDIYFDYGLQQTFRIDSLGKRRLKDKVRITIGATGGLASDLNAKRDVLSYSYFNTAFGSEVVKDTIENFTAQEGTLTLPLSYGAGFTIRKGERWTIGADYAYQNWASFSSFGERSDLKNSMRISVGANYTPNKFAAAKGSYGKWIQYRAGLRYYSTYLDLKNTQLTETSICLGVGLPAGQRHNKLCSMLNIGVELGQRGTTDNGLLKEQYLKAVIGLTINSKWFEQPKFD